MEVFIRHEDVADGVSLTECATQADFYELLADIAEEGVYYEGAIYREVHHQYILSAERAYVEIVIAGEGA